MNVLTGTTRQISPGVSRFAHTNVRTHCIFAVGIFTTNITRTLVYVYKKCVLYTKLEHFYLKAVRED